MIHICCSTCHTWQAVDVDRVVLTRRLPTGDGTLLYCCPACYSTAAVPLDAGAVMRAVFAGASAVDQEALRHA